MALFSPPARIDDFARSAKADELAAGWDAVIDDWLTRAAGDADGRFHNRTARVSRSAATRRRSPGTPSPW